jgi:signal transduction histidine kinase
MHVKKQALNAFADGKATSIACRTYGKPDGLPSGECTFGSQPSALCRYDGTLWFPTIAGLASLDPARLNINTNPPPVVIESVTVGQLQSTNALRLPPPESVTVPAGKEDLEIQYTSLNLAAPDKCLFKYRLSRVGHPEIWSAAGNIRTVPYPKLAPGQYRFEVIACNEDGVWNEAGASLTVTILPAFWQTWWFIGVTTAGLLGMIVGGVHYVSTQKLQRQVERLRHQEALEKERARIARDIHDQVGASLTQVSLLGELVESDKDNPEEVESHARQISQTALETTRALDEIVWTVNPSNDTLDGLINYVCKYAQEYLAVAGLRYRIEVPAQLPAIPISPELRHNVFLAAKEAVTNIVRHARASSAWLRLNLEPRRFTLEIEDDGRGLTGQEGQSTRNGLRNMRKRMEDIGGQFDIGPGSEAGTRVRLTAPLSGQDS